MNPRSETPQQHSHSLSLHCQRRTVCTARFPAWCDSRLTIHHDFSPPEEPAADHWLEAEPWSVCDWGPFV